jgi:hypothetical protein
MKGAAPKTALFATTILYYLVRLHSPTRDTKFWELKDVSDLVVGMVWLTYAE